MSRIEQRITGTENEWSIVQPDPTNEALLTSVPIPIIDEMITKCIPPYITKAGVGGGMLSNGGRLYKDMQCFIEYATPEDTSFDGTVTNELASERIILDMMQIAIDQGVLSPDARLHKRVISDTDHTWGYHASFNADPRRISVTLPGELNALAMHLATMNIYAGAGILRDESYGPTKYQPSHKLRYALAQKVLNLNVDFNKSSHSTEQPLVSMRDENLTGKSDDYSRLHVTSLDAHISPWATKMTLGTIAIVLRLMEEGYKHHKVHDIMPACTPMHRVAQHIAYDTELSYAMPCRQVVSPYSTRLRALDIQRILLTHAAQLDLPKQELEIWHEWQRALNVLEENPAKLIEADWVARRSLIARRTRDIEDPVEQRKKQLHWNDQYDRLDLPIRYNVAHALRTHTFKKHTPDPLLVSERMSSPPSSTRAAQRAELIVEHPTAHVLWDKVVYHDTESGHRVEYQLDDPYATDVAPTYLKSYGATSS